MPSITLKPFIAVCLFFMRLSLCIVDICDNQYDHVHLLSKFMCTCVQSKLLPNKFEIISIISHHIVSFRWI